MVAGVTVLSPLSYTKGSKWLAWEAEFRLPDVCCVEGESQHSLHGKLCPRKRLKRPLAPL